MEHFVLGSPVHSKMFLVKKPTYVCVYRLSNRSICASFSNSVWTDKLLCWKSVTSGLVYNPCFKVFLDFSEREKRSCSLTSSHIPALLDTHTVSSNTCLLHYFLLYTHFLLNTPTHTHILAVALLQYFSSCVRMSGMLIFHGWPEHKCVCFSLFSDILFIYCFCPNK